MSRLGFKSSGCSHKSSKSDCSFLSFPSNTFWREAWICAINRLAVDENGKVLNDKLWRPKAHHRLCSCHFSIPPNSSKRVPGWNHVKPDIFSGRDKPKTRPTRKSINRLPFASKPAKMEICDQTEHHMPAENKEDATAHPMNENIEEQINRQIHHDHDYLHTTREGRLAEALDNLVQTHGEFADMIDDYTSTKQIEEKYAKLPKGAMLSLATVKEEKDDIFDYYTGLPSYSVFEAIFNYLKEKATDMQYVSQAGKTHHASRLSSKPGRPRALPLDEELFITLVRLRLGLPTKDCARRFGICESTLSNIFNTWCILLSQELGTICTMPSSTKLQQCPAPCFDYFSNVRVVLDCTELFSQKPGKLENHKQHHSNYKHHSTVKFLVGMSPSGAIIYISDMWGGRASDKTITKTSDELMDAFIDGDQVMVDRGFTIAEDLPPGVKLLIPPFKNKLTGNFTADQLEYSEKISVARIHVERAMRAIKEYLILETEVKLAMINNYENIFKSCAYLVNFKRPFLKVK